MWPAEVVQKNENGPDSYASIRSKGEAQTPKHTHTHSLSPELFT